MSGEPEAMASPQGLLCYWCWDKPLEEAAKTGGTADFLLLCDGHAPPPGWEVIAAGDSRLAERCSACGLVLGTAFAIVFAADAVLHEAARQVDPLYRLAQLRKSASLHGRLAAMLTELGHPQLAKISQDIRDRALKEMDE